MISNRNSLPTVSQTRLSDQAYEVLRDSILRQELPSGHRLDLDSLQAQLGISRTPINEAVNRLAAEGLITVIPRRGSYVTELTVQDLTERFDLRQILELGVVEPLMTNLNDERLDYLRQLYSETKNLIAPDGSVADYFRYLDKDREFHRALVLIAGNELLLEIYDSLNLNLQMAKVFYLTRDKRIQLVDHEHRQILKALETRDAEALKVAIRNHIQSSLQAVISGIEPGVPDEAADTSSASD